jgi:hypothetical protein
MLRQALLSAGCYAAGSSARCSSGLNPSAFPGFIFRTLPAQSLVGFAEVTVDRAGVMRALSERFARFAAVPRKLKSNRSVRAGKHPMSACPP